MSSATDEILFHYRHLAQQREESLLFEKASFSKNHVRLYGPDEDHRMPYKRDVDRILHSKAYSRYVDKTQVAYLIENDHISHRGLHVQLVSSFARGIAEILGLNVDLVEAISLGHDVGHVPFAHEGEEYLSELSIAYGNSPFCHPLQSVRLFSEIEPLNLGITVYDGFLCHDGGMNGCKWIPKFEKTNEEIKQEQEKKKNHVEINLSPMTLEGCLVKICDTMSYVGRDIEDAIRLKIIDRNDIPETLLGKTNREILRTLAANIIHQSYGKEYIALSPEIYEALQVLREFNFQSIYHHPKLKMESQKIKQGFRILFEWLYKDMEKNYTESHLHREFLTGRSQWYLTNTNRVQMIVDYIAGMTDQFFISTLDNLFIPQKIWVK